MDQDTLEILVGAVSSAFISPNVADRNFEAANLVDTTDRIAGGLHVIGEALTRIAVVLEGVPVVQLKRED